MDFKTMYLEELANAREKYPEQYSWPREKLPEIAERMFDAMRRGTYSKDSKAIKAVCKRMGIKHTYAALELVISKEL